MLVPGRPEGCAQLPQAKQDGENNSFSCCFCPVCAILSQKTSWELESPQGLLVVPACISPCSLGQVLSRGGQCQDQRVFTVLGTRKGCVVSGVTRG